MKKIISFLLMIGFVLTIVGCSSSGMGKVVTPETIEPAFEEDGEMVYPFGNTVEMKDWTIHFKSYTPSNQLPATSNRILYPTTDYMFLIVNLEVTNNSETDKEFLPMVSALGGMNAKLVPVELVEDGYYVAENEMSYSRNPYGKSITAGETYIINLVFHLPNEVVSTETDWRLFVEYKSLMNDEEYELVIFGF